MDAVNRIFAYLNSNRSKGIHYSGKNGFQLQGFVDSDFAGCEDSRKSTTGWVFTLAGGPISWSSQRQKTVATSTLDAEYIAGAEAAKEAVWIRNFINDLRIPGLYVKSVPLFIDCNSALKLTRNPEFHSKSKHIDVKHHFIREKVESEEIDTQRVNTKDNLADVLTKALTRPTHEDLVGRLGMQDVPGTGRKDRMTSKPTMVLCQSGSRSSYSTSALSSSPSSASASSTANGPSSQSNKPTLSSSSSSSSSSQSSAPAASSSIPSFGSKPSSLTRRHARVGEGPQS